MLVELTVNTCDAVTGKRIAAGEVYDLPEDRASVAIAKGLAVAVEETPAEEPSAETVVKKTTRKKTTTKK